MTNQPKTKLSAREQRLKDQERAIAIMDAYVKLKREEEELRVKIDHVTAPIKQRYETDMERVMAAFKDKTEALKESIATAEKDLLEIGGKVDKKGNLVNRALFIDGNWHFEDADGYYLHIKTEAKVKTGPTFDVAKFIRKFGDAYCEVKFKIKELKKVFTDGDTRQKFMALDLDLKNEETVEIKQKAERA